MKLARLMLFFIASIALFSCFACAQNGPTKHQVTLTFTQGVPPAGSTIAYNCLYRGTATGVYTIPGTCSTAPVTTLTDSSVSSGVTYHYAVTAVSVISGTVEESAYSNDASATIPGTPTAPTLNTPASASLSKPGGQKIRLTAKVNF